MFFMWLSLSLSPSPSPSPGFSSWGELLALVALALVALVELAPALALARAPLGRGHECYYRQLNQQRQAASARAPLGRGHECYLRLE